ncbi:MAG: hypothetical protein ACKPKO_57340, partial [Candidatus Fonsibacter sp.]
EQKQVLLKGTPVPGFYPEKGKSSSASGAGKALTNWAGYPKLHDLTETGAHPMRWVELLQSWKLKTFRLALSFYGSRREHHVGSSAPICERLRRDCD